MKVYVLQRIFNSDMVENFGIFSTKEKANNILKAYKLLGADGNIQITEVEIDKEVSF